MRKNRFIKFIFPIICLLVLLPWPVAYAFEATAEEDAVQVKAAPDAAMPSFEAWGQAISGIPSGDLFYIDASNSAEDVMVTLYLLNPQELVSHYSYLILNVGVYIETGDGWEWASGTDGHPMPKHVLSMRNGQLSYLLPGYARYKIGIESGAVRCHNALSNTGSLSPLLHLEVN